MTFYEKHKGSMFMAQVKTKIGIGNLIGSNPDKSQFLLAFKTAELNKEYLANNSSAGNIINLWVDTEDIYVFTSEETAPLPKRVVASQRRKKK